MLQDTPQTLSRLGPDARNGLSLAHNGCFSRSLHSGVNVPDLLLRFLLAASAARSAFQLRYPLPVSPGEGLHRSFWPVAVSTTRSKIAPPASTPLGDFYLPPDQSVLLD